MPVGDMDDGVARMPPHPEAPGREGGWGPGASLWSRILRCGGRPAEPPVSGYEVLIHDCSQRFGSSTIRLSDPRLRSRFPIWMILALGLMFVCGILIVFFLVPRGMAIGTTSAFNVTTIYLNQTYSKYRLVAKLKIPILNYNYIDGYVSGNVTMRFYHATAGTQHIEKHRIESRTISSARQTEITATVDASFVPLEYIARVLDNCLHFPYELVFFVSGDFESTCMGQKKSLSFDTYKFIECPNLPPDMLPPDNSRQTLPAPPPPYPGDSVL